MLTFCVLSSGSKANCLYVSSGDTRVLIDCGLSARETVRRLEEINVAAESIAAVVVTHEHEDHVRGIETFAKKFLLSHDKPIFANAATVQASPALSKLSSAVCTFSTGSAFTVGPLFFEPFSVMHDAADPVAFRVTAGGTVLGVVTDLGQVTNLVRERTACLDAIVIEANHEPDMLAGAPYPWVVKQRISGRSGHLSNQEAAGLVEHLHLHDDGRLQVVIAGHISEKSNTPELAVSSLEAGWARGPGTRKPHFVASSASKRTMSFSL